MTDNNRPQSRFGPLDDGAPVRAQAPRPAQGARPAQGTRPAQGARPAPQAPRTSAKPRERGLLPQGFVPLAVVCAAIVALGVVLQALMPDGFALTGKKDLAERPVAAQVSEIHGDGPIRLNEVMSANGGVLTDENGETGDWVEVANVGSRPVNLQGYVLAKSAKAGNVFQFPDMILQPGGCAVVFADNTLQTAADGALHAPFRLSSGGDVLMLFNAADVAVDTVNLPALEENQAYVRVSRNEWEASDQTTPGALNTEENYRAMTSVVQNSPVRLVEIVASNTKYRPDESGVARDYVVLRNTSGEAVSVGGWYLSDDAKLPRLWRFPEGVVIPGGGTLTVFCSGESRTDDPSHLHTGFRLSSEGETVTLSNADGRPVDIVTYDLLRTDTAYLRGEGGWSVGEPTE